MAGRKRKARQARDYVRDAAEATGSAQVQRIERIVEENLSRLSPGLRFLGAMTIGALSVLCPRSGIEVEPEGEDGQRMERVRLSQRDVSGIGIRVASKALSEAPIAKR